MNTLKDQDKSVKQPETSAPLTKKEQKQLKKKEKKEGRRIKTIEPINAFMPFIMKTRNDACNLFEAEFDTKAADEYISQKRKEGLKSFSMMHLLVAAYVRTVAEYPGINRFVRGQRIMARNKIVIVMTIKREMELDRGETVVKFYPKPTDTAEEIFRHMEETIKNACEDTNTDFDKTAARLMKTPRFLLRGAIRFLDFLDYHGKLPRFLTDVSPFHGSLYITSMGSLGIPPIYHHIYNFGNVPLFLSFGGVEKKLRLNADGSVTQKRCMPVKVTCDERICDGHYYAMFFKSIRHYFKNPALLDAPPAEVKEDIP